jgi:hypothetical protein
MGTRKKPRFNWLHRKRRSRGLVSNLSRQPLFIYLAIYGVFLYSAAIPRGGIFIT